MLGSTPNPNLSANLNVMIEAARKAARGLIRDFGEVENLLVSIKGPGDFVSNADRKAETVIRDVLMNARPNYGWLAEESDAVAGKDPTRRWIVDPLDGTTNFLHGIPHWSISIALEHKGDIVAGVVFDPIKNELYYAEKGGGAFMNDRRLRVSRRRDLTDALVCSRVPYAGDAGLPRRLRELTAVLPKSAGMRVMGSAALDMAWVAAGRLDAYWDVGLSPWDLAAGVALVREAGGFVASLEPGRAAHDAGAIVVGPEGAFDALNAVLKSER